MTTKSPIDHEALQEEWEHVPLHGNEETPNEFPVAETGFEFVASPYYVTWISGDSIAEIEL